MEGGWVVVEAMVPDDDPDSPDAVVVPTRIEAGEVVMQCTIRDRSAQTVSGSVIAVSQAGVRLRPWSIRYATPEQLDAMAAGAGLEMAQRWSDWHEGSFTGESTLAITLYHRVRAPAGKIQNVALPVAVDR